MPIALRVDYSIYTVPLVDSTSCFTLHDDCALCWIPLVLIKIHFLLLFMLIVLRVDCSSCWLFFMFITLYFIYTWSWLHFSFTFQMDYTSYWLHFKLINMVDYTTSWLLFRLIMLYTEYLSCWLHFMLITLLVHYPSCWLHFMLITLLVDYTSCWLHFMLIALHVDYTLCRLHSCWGLYTLLGGLSVSCLNFAWEEEEGSAAKYLNMNLQKIRRLMHRADKKIGGISNMRRDRDRQIGRENFTNRKIRQLWSHMD